MKLSRTPRPSGERLPWYQRLLLLIGGVIAVGLLITAATLEADSRGFGTHQQLGLPPCTFTQIFDSRCPSCGMTTSWTQMMHGRIAASFRANSGGALLALIALVGGPWSLLSGLKGRWFGIVPNEWAVLIAALAVMAVTLIDWCIRLMT